MPELQVPAEVENNIDQVYNTDVPTGPQTLDFPDEYDHKFPKRLPVSDWYNVVRELRRDPTIALVRQLSVVPAILGPWTLETDGEPPEGAKEFVQDNVVAWKNYLLRTTFHNCMDFGWAGYEKLFKVNKEGQVTCKFKALLPDYTDILMSADNGMFMGFAQNHPDQPEEIAIQLPEAFLHSWDVEGQEYYGQGYMENVRRVAEWWTDANASAARYDKKIAGAYWVIRYPDGSSKFNGVETPNEVIAKALAAEIRASGTIILPRKIANIVKDLNAGDLIEAWEIHLESPGGTATNGFTDRLTYLDKLKVRGLGFPERAILEGQFGTKAEAEAHADFAIAGVEIRHDDFLQTLNWHAVNQLLRINFGPEAENTVFIKRGPIADSSRQYLQEIYKMILQNPSGWIEEIDQIDKLELKRLTRIPIDEEVVREREESDGLFDTSGRGSDIREGQRPPMGNGEQRRGPGGDRTPSDGGDRMGGRTNR